MSRETITRIAVHLLLAAFVANAANKFFVPDLDYEAAHSFYAKIFDFKGEAPDQYRILPLLPIKLLNHWLPFNLAVMAYNFLCAFLCLAIMRRLLRGFKEMTVLAVEFSFSGLYIYLQYTGWRPDTLGLVMLAFAFVMWMEEHRNTTSYSIGLLAGIVALSFSRADFALVLGAFAAVYRVKGWAPRIAMVMLPVAVQILLQFVVFPEAPYYTKAIMVWDNLSGYYLLRNPASFLLVAGLIAWRKNLIDAFQWLRAEYPIFLLLFGGYILLVFVVGRVNEFRIFLPFLPLFLVFWREMRLKK